MANWLRVNALLRNIGDSQKSEILGLPDLEVESIVKPIVIDLDRIESYAPSLDAEGNEIEDEVDIILYSGLSITLKYDYDKFDKLLRLKNNG